MSGNIVFGKFCVRDAGGADGDGGERFKFYEFRWRGMRGDQPLHRDRECRDYSDGDFRCGGDSYFYTAAGNGADGDWESGRHVRISAATNRASGTDDHAELHSRPHSDDDHVCRGAGHGDIDRAGNDQHLYSSEFFLFVGNATVRSAKSDAW